MNPVHPFYGLHYLVLFFPICLVVLLVLETCRSDDPRKIVKRSLANLGMLTLVLGAGSLVVYLVNRFL